MLKPSPRARKYRITEEHLQVMLAAQSGRCAICNELAELVVDHDHATGMVRNALCNPCNLALGLMRDDPSILLRAASYLTGIEYARKAPG